MKPLRVLVLITKSNWGGAQRYVYDLATRLPKDRFKVEVMAGGDGPLIAKLREAGVSVSGALPVGRDVKFGADIKAFFWLISLLREKRPDILHVNSSKIGGIGALAGRLCGVKRIIFTAHGWAFNENRPLTQKLAIRALYWVTLLLSHEAIAVSHTAKRQVKNLPKTAEKIAVIHNGIDKETGFARRNARLELMRMNEPLRRSLEHVSENAMIWVGTIAELHAVKGHEYAIRAVADCVASLKRTDPNKHLVYTIMGDGDEREAMETLISSLGMQDHIILMGHVPAAAQYVKAFDVFLLASLSEGLGYVLLEAGAAGVAVVGTAVGGIPEVIDDMDSGILVQPKNSRELAHALLFMIEHPAERATYGAALREKVLRDFSLEQMVAKTAEVYTKTSPTAAPQTHS